MRAWLALSIADGLLKTAAYISMQIGRVIENVTATKKRENLVGAKFLVIQPVDIEGNTQGFPFLAVDAAQAGIGDRVVVVLEGRAAVSAFHRQGAPIDAAVIGVVDSVGSTRTNEQVAGNMSQM